MSRTFRGRPILPGHVVGEALVTRAALNTFASFRKCLTLGTRKAVCSDQDSRELYGKVMTGKVLCLPQTVGSTAGGLALETAVCRGVAPEALLFSEHIDSLAAAGCVLADGWFGRRIVTVDQLGKEFLAYVEDGQKIEVREDGTVLVD